MPKLEVTKLTSHFKKFMPVETVIMVTAVHILFLECDFDISLDELIYSLDKTASRMATALLIVATSITRADCTFFSVNSFSC